MKTRRLGPEGPEVSAIGLGCMGMASAYGEGLDEAQAATVIHRALDLGVTLFDTAEMYGPIPMRFRSARRWPTGATRPSSPPSSASTSTPSARP